MIIPCRDDVIAPPASRGPSSAPAGAAPTHFQSDTQSQQKVEAALADVSVDFDIIITEGDRLKEDFGKFENWSTASDNEIELAMNKVEEWRRKFERLQDKRWSIQRKTLSFKLDERKMKSATSYMNTLGSELDMAVEDITQKTRSAACFRSIERKLPVSSFPHLEELEERTFLSLKRK